ncbi:protein PIN-LIKES 1 isoform X2 [Ananas comosus]|uniref:Protein PIN-LIKES 1 isoform X2 n=1 Tax=Ananas comosus TaxID=4615 RepID=A0A6P5GMP8_ANACO|nr:protein PIN-LIKES 1 isoform X2 [Ananas comosus]
MGLLDLFVTATMPVLNVLLVTGVGSFLATGYIGILVKDARKHLNNIVFYVFNPALVATNLSQTITMDSMILLWFMPINILLTFIFGLLFGWVVIQITRPPTRLRALILGCCAAGNLGNMLLIIIPAICKEKGSPFGEPAACHTYGLAYTSLSMAIGAIFLWSVVYNIMRLSSNTAGGMINTNGHTQTVQYPEETDKLISSTCTAETIPTNKCLVTGEYADDCTLPIYDGSESSTRAKIVGFIIGVIPQLRKAMIGESAPLRVIQESAAVLGDGAIPTVTLIMGGNLINGLRGSRVNPSIIIGIIVVRYILLPLVGIVIVKGAVRLGLVHADPLYQFILLLQYAVPPAMNIGTITQLFGAGESECSVILLWAYSLASVSLTIWSTFFMWSVSS